MDVVTGIIERTGTKSGLSFIVQFGEDDWLNLLPDTREDFQRELLAKAIEEGSEVACIRLVPDELFSTTGAAKPYIGWQQRTRIQKPNPYEDVKTTISALTTLVQGSRASQTDYVYIPRALAEAVLTFCSVLGVGTIEEVVAKLKEGK